MSDRRALSKDEIEARRRGGRTRAQQFTREYQQAARSCVKRESLVKAGRAGYAACSERVRLAHKQRAAAWRRRNPSEPERIVMSWLDEWGIEYKHEWEPFGQRGIFFDINITDRRFHRLLIEVDGNGFHGPNALDADKRAERDRRKESWAAYNGFAILRLHEKSVRDGTAKAALEAFLRNGVRQ